MHLTCRPHTHPHNICTPYTCPSYTNTPCTHWPPYVPTTHNMHIYTWHTYTLQLPTSHIHKTTSHTPYAHIHSKDKPCTYLPHTSHIVYAHISHLAHTYPTFTTSYTHHAYIHPTHPIHIPQTNALVKVHLTHPPAQLHFTHTCTCHLTHAFYIFALRTLYTCPHGVHTSSCPPHEHILAHVHLTFSLSAHTQPHVHIPTWHTHRMHMFTSKTTHAPLYCTHTPCSYPQQPPHTHPTNTHLTHRECIYLCQRQNIHLFSTWTHSICSHQPSHVHTLHTYTHTPYKYTHTIYAHTLNMPTPVLTHNTGPHSQTCTCPPSNFLPAESHFIAWTYQLNAAFYSIIQLM